MKIVHSILLSNSVLLLVFAFFVDLVNTVILQNHTSYPFALNRRPAFALCRSQEIIATILRYQSIIVSLSSVSLVKVLHYASVHIFVCILFLPVSAISFSFVD